MRLTLVFLCILSTLGLSAAKAVPKTDFDVIIVGGGPAGLSAMSALCRVSRRAVLFDTSEYRNNATRNMHDVIGNDGAPPKEFRAAAREQIDKYDLATWVKEKVVDVQYTKRDGHLIFTATDAQRKRYTARRLILATGVTDILPETPGVMDAYGKGMYWCPWCDGFEHRGQSLAVLGPLSDALSSVLEMHNINPDTVVLTNGTDTPAERAIAFNRSSTWEKQLEAYKVPIINNTIVRIERLRDGGEACSSPAHSGPPKPNSLQQQLADETPAVIPVREDAGPNGKHYDLFRIHFKDGLRMERAAFLINVPVKQTSTLPKQLGLLMDGPKVNVTGKTASQNIEGVFAIGDMNNEGSTNVPHAMYNGKKAAVVVHVQLAKEDSLAAISKRSISAINDIQMERVTMGQIGNELEHIWDKIKAQFGSTW